MQMKYVRMTFKELKQNKKNTGRKLKIAELTKEQDNNDSCNFIGFRKNKRGFISKCFIASMTAYNCRERILLAQSKTTIYQIHLNG